MTPGAETQGAAIEAGPLDGAPLPADAYRLSQTLRALENPPASATAIALHNMAAELMAQQVGSGRRGLVVCGPSRESGVSFIAANLAIALAKLGASVLLIDADLRDPEIDGLITPAVTPPRGLGDLIEEDNLTLDDVVHREVLPNLSILYAGSPFAHASELIGRTRCVEVLRECMRDYDYTLVDTPPANRTTDGRRIAAVIGYAMIVARQNVTYVDDVATLASELTEDGAVIVASLLNRP